MTSPPSRLALLLKNGPWLVIAGFATLLALAAWAFHPGLGGRFIFDDTPNLQPWADLGDISSLGKMMSFAFSSKFFPGRPLSMLSFLIDDQSWPPDVVALKRTNLALHLVNACLVFWFALKLLEHLLPDRETRQRAWLALFVTAVWALHPLQVSTVSYIIQRMCLLNTTLTLLALLLFLHGRAALDTAPIRAMIVCSIAVGVGMPLAILAKENGLLVCAFVLLLESFCFDQTTYRAWRIWKAAFLWLPLAAFVAYCLYTYRFFTTGFDTRHFNAWERLLSQGPVLGDYVRKLLLPRLSGSSLYVDNFPISHSLFSPPGTAVYWAIIVGSILYAWKMRRRLPLVSFGILFFFCGHLMESTLLPLELYFEHRNYLPQAGLWMSVAGLLAQPASPQLRRILTAAVLGWIALLTIITHNNAMLWARPDLQAAMWYRDNPGSLRTTLGYANALLEQGDAEGAGTVLENGTRLYPNIMSLRISQRLLQCFVQDRPTRFDDLPALARTADYDTGGIVVLEKMRSLHILAPRKTSGCQQPTEQQIGQIYLGYLENPKFSGDQTALTSYMAEISLAYGDATGALHYYQLAFKKSADPAYGYFSAVLLQKMGRHAEARSYADLSLQALNWREQIRYPHLRGLLEKIRSGPSGTGSGKPS